MGICYLMQSGGGGGSLNFKIIPNPMPSTAKENTIWVDTDRINNYYFSAEQPENMVEYDVWFSVGTSSYVAFSATKKNPIMVYPLYAKQYVSGAWVEKTAKSYLGGEWVEWIPEGALYYRGNECTHNGGAWVNKAWAMNYNGYTGVKADVFQKNAEYITMRLTNSGSGPSTTLIKETPVDLTNINTVTFMFNVTGAQYISFFACKGNEAYFLSGTTYSHHNIPDFGGNDNSVRLDVSSLSGSYIIGIGLAHNAENQTTTLVLKEVMMS